MSDKKDVTFVTFLETLLQVIEAKKISYPKIIYCLMIITLYSQYAGYIFSSFETKPLFDKKSLFLAHWNEYSTGTFLLFKMGEDKITLIILIIFSFALIFCFVYIMLLTIIRIKAKQFHLRLEKLLTIINSFYQLYFSSFLWVLYIPCTEIHAGTMVVGSNSFFFDYRNDTNYSEKPIFMVLIGGLGVFLTLILGITLSYCYISYDFYDSNLLKRTFRPNQIIQLISRTLLCLLYYVNFDNIMIIKHIFGHILGLTSLYDYFMYIPFRDKFICNFYGIVTGVFELSMILISGYELTDYFPEANIFFTFLMPISFFIGFVSVFYSKKIYSLFEIKPSKLSNKSSIINLLDIYLDKLYELGLNSEIDNKNKIRLLGIIEYLKKNLSPEQNFFLKKKELNNILNLSFQIQIDKLIEIINEIFQIFLKNPKIISMTGNYEQILLKYCAFLANYQNNPIRAFYELKRLLQSEDSNKSEKKVNFSIVFKIVSSIISKNIEFLIYKECQLKYEKLIDCNMLNDKDLKNQNLSKKSTNNLNIITYARIDELKYTYISQLKQCVNFKISFFEKMLMGFNSMDKYLESVLDLMKKIKNLTLNLENSILEISKTNWKESILLLKLKAISDFLIFNDPQFFIDLKEKIKEFKKIESTKAENLISKSSILERNSIVISISLLDNTLSKICNKKNLSFTNFFGFLPEEISCIHDIMPEFMGEIHPEIIQKFIKYGPQNVFNNDSRQLFAVNRDKFIFPVNLYLNFSLLVREDYCISGIFTQIKDSGTTILLNEQFEIIGVTRNILNEIMNCNIIDISQLYKEKCKIMYLFPDIIDYLPSEEQMNKILTGKEKVIELTTSLRNSIFNFPKNIKIFLLLINSYHRKNFTKINFKNYSDLFEKNLRGYFRRFNKSNSLKEYITKKVISFSLSLELFDKPDGTKIKTFILRIKNSTNLEDMQDELTSSLSKSMTSGANSSAYSGTFQTQTQTEGIANEIAQLNKGNENENNENESISTEDDKNKKNDQDSSENKEIFQEDKKDKSSQASSINKNTAINDTILKDIIDFNFKPRFLNQINLVIIFQSLCLALLSIITFFIIKNQIDYINESTQKGYLVKRMIFSHINNVFLNHIIYINSFNLTQDSLKIISEIKEQSYINLKIEFEEKEIINYIDKTVLNIYSINSFSNESSIEKISIFNFFKQIQQNLFNLLSDYKLNNYLFLRYNFLQSLNLNSDYINKENNDRSDSISNLQNNFLILMIISLIIVFVLQFLFFNLYRNFIDFNIKILNLILRFKNSEVEKEIKKFKSLANALDTNTDQFLTYNFIKEDKLLLEEKEIKINKKKGFSHISSKIQNSDLSKGFFYKFSCLNIISLVIFFSISFMIVRNTESELNFVEKCNLITQDYLVNLYPLKSIQLLLFTKNKFKEENKIEEDDFINLKIKYFEHIDFLNKLNDNYVEKTGSTSNIFDSILNKDACYLFNQCSNNNENHFIYGLRGYTSYFLNRAVILKDILNEKTDNMNLGVLFQNDIYYDLRDFQILNYLIDKMLTESQIIFEKTLDQSLNETFVRILLIELVLCVILIILGYFVNLKLRKNTNLVQTFLIMIPIFKKNDEVLIHMLKNITKF